MINELDQEFDLEVCSFYVDVLYSNTDIYVELTLSDMALLGALTS